MRSSKLIPDLQPEGTRSLIPMHIGAASLWAVYIWVLPIGGTIALRNLVFFLLILLTLWLALRGRVRLFLPQALSWLPYVSIALYSLSHSVDSMYSMNEFKGEVLFGMIACMLSATWFCREASYRYLLNMLALGNAFLIGIIVWQFLVVAPFWNYSFSDMAGGSMLNAGVYHKLYNGVGSLSTYLVTILPYIVAMAAYGTVCRYARTSLVLIAGGDVVLLFLSGNRMSMIVLGMEVIVFVFLLSRRYRARSTPSLLAVASTVLIVLFLLFSAQKSVKEVDADPRWQIWSSTSAYIAQSPWQGYGFGRNIMQHGNTGFVAATSGMPHAHNLLVNKVLQMGIPGALAFLFLVGSMLNAVWPRNASRMDKSQWVWSATTSIMIIGVVLKSMTDDFFIGHLALLFWALVGAGIGFLRHANTSSGGRHINSLVP